MLADQVNVQLGGRAHWRLLAAMVLSFEARFLLDTVLLKNSITKFILHCLVVVTAWR